jgi:hypothetical protein
MLIILVTKSIQRNGLLAIDVDSLDLHFLNTIHALRMSRVGLAFDFNM